VSCYVMQCNIHKVKDFINTECVSEAVSEAVSVHHTLMYSWLSVYLVENSLNCDWAITVRCTTGTDRCKDLANTFIILKSGE
jgi:hypothetical protein